MNASALARETAKRCAEQAELVAGEIGKVALKSWNVTVDGKQKFGGKLTS